MTTNGAAPAVGAHPDPAHLDPARWVTLAIVLLSAFIVVLDNTVLNVAIPTILRDFHTTLPALEWVVTGYALTFATLLIIGGRLGDIYGHRRIFIIGAALFGVGSLIASVATSVPQLILGEAIIEGIGASLMLPATLALLSGTFHGRERATAFAAWGASAGVAAACGPVVGGFLTSNYSWRWSFRINVIIAPLAIIGAFVFMRDNVSTRRRVKIDVLGALIVATGMFLFVFALSEGGTYGWLTPVEKFSVAGRVVWPASRSVSIMPIVFVVALVILCAFYFVERSKERRNAAPLFEFAHLKLKSYRYGLLTGLVLAMGQLGLSFVLPVFLQDGKHLTAARNGLWLLPTGLFVIIGAQVGGRLIRKVGATVVVRIGLVLYAVGVALVLRSIDLNLTVWGLFPGLACYGAGIGFAGAQLTNVVLSEIPNESSGVASGANTTVRQVGSALGVAVIGSLLTAQTTSHAIKGIRAADLAAGTKAQALSGVHALGTNYRAPGSISAHDSALLTSALEHGVATGTRFALGFAIVVVAAGAMLSFLIPRAPAQPGERSYRSVDVMEPLEPFDPDPALVDG